MLVRGGALCAGLWMILGLATSQLTEEDRATIMDMHNLYRSQVAPSAAYMLKMRWDEALKVVAEAYTAKCVLEHNPDLHGIGENLFATNGPFNTTKAMTNWYMEYLDYDYNNNICKDDNMCGHYTQVVWSDSKSVGCASHLCDTVEGLTAEKVTVFICNYYPMGNNIGKRPYELGEPCSKCPEDLQQCVHNMCVPEDSEEQDPEEETTQSPVFDTEVPQTPPSSTDGSAHDTATEQPTAANSSVSSPNSADKEQREMPVDEEEEQGTMFRGGSGSVVASVSPPLLLLASLLARLIQ